MTLLTYRGGPLDGRVAAISAKGDVRIPCYAKGYGRAPTSHLHYVRQGRELIYTRCRKPSTTP